MKFEVVKDDPLNILTSTKAVVENLQYIAFDESKISALAEKIIERFNQGLDEDYELGIGVTPSLKDDLQLVFIENVVNFCFWPSMGEKKWGVEWPKGNIVSGGWYGLVACFKRGIAEGVPILNSEYLKSMSTGDARQFFRGVEGAEIPLLEKRVENLREAGEVLSKEFDGQIINLIEKNNYDAVEIVRDIIEHFPSFRDVSVIEGKEIRFLKRAQICPNDFSYLLKKTNKPITGLDKLTAYADYKLPQILRMFGVISYNDTLSQKVDDMVEIEHEFREEIEIRASTVWGIELLRQHIGSLTAGDIDNTIWVMSQKLQDDSRPHHRTRTIYY
ncbi:MAG: queuosine salvage family protein [Candidatus Paceibacterota bacterium]